MINEGIQDICPPGMCDNYDLSVVLPAPAVTFYQTKTALLTIHFTWTSTVPTDLDIFGISPRGADHGPGSPDDTSTGPGEEVLTITDPLDGVWHMRSVASLAPIPTAAHAVATLTITDRPMTRPPPPPPPGSPTFVNYPAPEDCSPTHSPPNCIQPSPDSTTSGQHGAGEPSIGVNWANRFGRVLVGYADGCTGACVHNPSVNTYDALATIALQVGGRGLFAAFDGTQFGTHSGDDTGGGRQCSGDAAQGVRGDPECNDHDDDD